MRTREAVFDVPPGQFDSRVLDAPADLTVVVDFWAEWCGPCRSLGPILERVVVGYGGRVVLAKVNIDQDREAAMRLGIQSIPTVKIFRGGQIVGEFMGALPEAEVARIVAAAVPSVADELVAEGDRRLETGKAEAAAENYEKALREDPHHTGALLRLGTAAAEQGRPDEARALLGRIEEDAEEYEAARAVLARFEFEANCRRRGGEAACRRAVEADPDDLGARYDLACCLVVREDYEGALDELLTVLSADKNHGDGAAREAVLRVFALAGPRSELANAYRRKLATVLY
ncbi:MAG: tetratricopeptide repeat protein [Candidatus Brocadiaceae bacterium]|nr:tetratricopeptide repeat protein [Candidatus Brocadiaceae bacterium]